MSSYNFIAVEGNIGAGKSTVAALLAQHYNAKLIAEEFADNNFLPKFYQEPNRYAFPLELSFLADRYKQMQTINPDLFGQKVVSDYVFAKSKLFARVNLDNIEYDLFQRFSDILTATLPIPDLLIYLHAPIGRLQQNIKKRGREYEQNIHDDYLQKVQDIYQQFLKQNTIKTIIIDTTQADLVNNKAQFNELISFIDKDYDFTSHSWSPQ